MAVPATPAVTKKLYSLKANNCNIYFTRHNMNASTVKFKFFAHFYYLFVKNITQSSSGFNCSFNSGAHPSMRSAKASLGSSLRLWNVRPVSETMYLYCGGEINGQQSLNARVVIYTDSNILIQFTVLSQTLIHMKTYSIFLYIDIIILNQSQIISSAIAPKLYILGNDSRQNYILRPATPLFIVIG